MTELYWTPEAIADRGAIYDHIEAKNPAAALALDTLFAEKSGQLTAYPERARAGRVPGTRELVVHRHYLLVYDLIGERIRILRVLHVARQWPAAD